MKAIQLIQDTPYNLLKKAFANFGHFEIQNPLPFKSGKQIPGFQQKVLSAFGGRLKFKPLFNYLLDASIEGLKQNFFGPNINMEFFTLTIRVYFILLIRLTVNNPSII
jgi:hypothetical protein